MTWSAAAPATAAAKALRAGRPISQRARRSGPRVLLADDNADMKEYLQRLLEPTYDVTTAADGLAALEAARADLPDLVISDVMMRPAAGGIVLAASSGRVLDACYEAFRALVAQQTASLTRRDEP